jgi:hypothetical protein
MVDGNDGINNEFNDAGRSEDENETEKNHLLTREIASSAKIVAFSLRRSSLKSCRISPTCFPRTACGHSAGC